MIFAVPSHIELIKKAIKTETRRNASAINRYEVGKTYAIQPKRTAKGIPEGRILIKRKWIEAKTVNFPITEKSAIAEGNYTVESYEKLYEKLNPNWTLRATFSFAYVVPKFVEANL
jgi:hypothetical protein